MLRPMIGCCLHLDSILPPVKYRFHKMLHDFSKLFQFSYISFEKIFYLLQPVSFPDFLTFKFNQLYPNQLAQNKNTIPESQLPYRSNGQNSACSTNLEQIQWLCARSKLKAEEGCLFRYQIIYKCCTNCVLAEHHSFYRYKYLRDEQTVQQRYCGTKLSGICTGTTMQYAVILKDAALLSLCTSLVLYGKFAIFLDSYKCDHNVPTRPQ